MGSIFGRMFKKNSKYFILVIILILLTFTSKISTKKEEYASKGVLLIDTLGPSEFFQNELKNICEKNNEFLEIKENNITVDYFKEISGDYSLIILRLHSTCQSNVTWMFTGEQYSPSKYISASISDSLSASKVILFF